ncbi:hypothetical protein M9458_026507, partial [Cirrhinus mrigala]
MPTLVMILQWLLKKFLSMDFTRYLEEFILLVGEIDDGAFGLSLRLYPLPP